METHIYWTPSFENNPNNWAFVDGLIACRKKEDRTQENVGNELA